MNRYKLLFVLFAALTFGVGHAWAQACDYDVPAPLPTVYETNTWYAGTPSVPPSYLVDSSSTIVNFQYYWTFTRAVPGLEVYVCINNGSYCAVANSALGTSASGSGSTTVFNGKTSDQPFTYWVRVNSPVTSNLSPPLQGTSSSPAQVNANSLNCR